MAYRADDRRKLSKSILEMKFMKRSKERVQREQDAVEGEAMFSDMITKDMKQGTFKYVLEPSYVPCENLIVGRLSFLGMNPEIERIMEAEEEAARITKKSVTNEVDISDVEMAKRYNILVGTISRKFSTKNEKKTRTDKEFIKPVSDD